MLTDRDKTRLDIEATRWKYAAAKDTAIHERLGETPTTYYQRLHELLRNPEAVAFAPVLVSRLLRLEAARRAARTARDS